MTANRTRSRRIGVFLATLTFVVAGCGAESPSSSPSDGGAAPDESVATGTDESGGALEGLCSWASPAALEKVFGEPVDALGGKECRVVPSDETGSEGFYHLRLDQVAGYDELEQRLVENQESQGFTICDSESLSWQELRISRRVICPGNSDTDFSPLVALELGPGRVLTNLPFASDNKKEAQEASRRFVEIMKVFAAGAAGQAVINEVLPGRWVELYNPGEKRIDLSGATLTGYDDFDDALRGTLPVPDGSLLAPGAHLVVDITGLEGTTGDTPMIELATNDGRFMDVMDITSVTGGEVARRDEDGGLICGFGSAKATPTKPNPSGCD